MSSLIFLAIHSLQPTTSIQWRPQFVTAMSDAQLKCAVEQAGETLFQLVYQHFESMPRNATPEVVWRMTAELAGRIISVYKLLTRAAESVPSRVSYGETPSNIKDDAFKLIQTKRMLTGLVHRMKSVRNSTFSSACRDLPAPVKNRYPNSTTRVLHEMLFVATDCFIELGLVQPGKHGRIFVFREELRDWLLSALEPFHVVYQDRNGTRTQYGAYKAILLPGANMIGPEFVQLSDSTREIIVTHMSRNDRGSESYEAEYQNLVLSLKTLPCILLQCVELPPGTYQNSAAHQTNSLPNPIKVQPQPKRRLSPRPPGLPVPPVIILKRGSDQASANLLNNNSALTSDDTEVASGGPVPHPYTRPVSSAPKSRAVPSAAIDDQLRKKPQQAGTPAKQSGAEINDNSTAKARPGIQPSHTLARSVAQSRVPYSTNANREIAFHSSTNPVATGTFQDRGYNVGLTKPTAGGALSAYQNWQAGNIHQNLIQSGEIQRQIVPPRLHPMPLQSGARSNQANPQFGFQSVTHSSIGSFRKNALDSALLARTQVAPVSLYRPPQMRGSHSLIRDQNINPVWYSTEGNPPAAGMYGSPYNGRPVVSQPFLNTAGMRGDHGNQNALPSRFQASTSYFGQRM